MAYSIIDEVVAADKSGLTAADVGVLLVVAWHADKDTREAWPGTPLLAEETGLSDRAIRDALTRLRTPNPETGFAWLQTTYEGYHQRLLTISKDLPKRQPRASRYGRTPHPDAEGDAALRQDLPDTAQDPCGNPRLTMRQELPDDAADPSRVRRELPHDAAGSATEPVSNQSEEQVIEQEKNQGETCVSRGGEDQVRTPQRPVTSNQGLVDYFLAAMRKTLKDYSLPIPGGFKQPLVLGRLKQIRKESGVEFDELVELVDLYMTMPSLWNRKVHPLHDFVTGNTFARLRNRLHEQRVTTSSVRHPDEDEYGVSIRLATGYSESTAEGSDDQ